MNTGKPFGAKPKSSLEALFFSLILWLWLNLGGCASTPTPTPSADSPTQVSSSGDPNVPPYNTQAAAPGSVLAAWSQIVGPGLDAVPKVMARFVVQGADSNCGGFDAQVVPAGSPAPAFTGRSNPDRQAFPVTVCQAELDPTVKQWQLAGAGGPVSLWQAKDTGPAVAAPGPAAIVARSPLSMVTLGDTGCRGEGSQSDCSVGSKQWPFQQVANKATGRDANFLIHVGDYRYYFENQSPDTWDYWYSELFLPARRLLLDTPWVFVRGNHEQCSGDKIWYGKGYLYLLEPTTDDQTSLCGQGGDQLAPWHFDVASNRGGDNYRFVVLDSAVGSIPSKDLKKSLTLTRSSDTWWTSHHPFLGLYFDKGQAHYPQSSLQTGLQSALMAGSRTLCQSGACAPTTFLSGHIHVYQHTELFAPGTTSGHWTAPRQMIVGHGGVDLRGELKQVPCTLNNLPAPFDGSQGVVDLVHQFGFVQWQRTPGIFGGWKQDPIFLKSRKAPARGLPPCSG